MKRTIIAIALLLITAHPLLAQGRGGRGGGAQGQAPARIVSPEVTADRMVTFRLRAPDARRVTVVVSEIMRQVPGYNPEWATGTFNDDEVEMKKGADGVWSLAVGPILADKYDYSFRVDGVHTLDPANLDLKPGDSAVENWLTVRGREPLYSDNLDVPHGAVTTIAYRSKTLGLNRFVNVYTPPGYEMSATRYPVLYLLHGAGNRFDTWVSADAAYILDNLLAKKAIVPMIVVMPNGHVAPGAREVPAGTPAGAFGADFINDIMPLVESRFRIQADREHRAIAGLSMGAGHTAAIGFANLGLFSHIALMSGVGLTGDGQVPAYIPPSAEVNSKLKFFWMGRGKTENIAGARAFSKALTEKGYKHTLHESDFGHSWITWRRDLQYEIAPRLFR